MTTLKDLSRHLGLSVTQVSRALNDHADVSEKTKVRVRDAAKSLNYEANVLARRLVTGRSGIVGLVYPTMPDPSDSWYFMQFVAGLSKEFSRLGRQFMLHMPDDAGDHLDVYDRLVRSRSIDGFIIMTPMVADPRVNFLRSRSVPFVLHGQTMDEPDYPFFDIDNMAVGYDLTAYLADRGHREIAIINGNPGASFVERRFDGYRQALRERGLPNRAQFEAAGMMTADLGLLETVRMFQSDGPKPTGIIASNLRIAKGIISALNAMGLRVPQDVSVVAHDDKLPDVSAESLGSGLTTTEAPLGDSWEPLARFLNATLDGAPLSEVQEVGPHSLVERGSVAVR
ncbi:LacI family transcriptional regulator [Loktanella sp. IMCC34160]|uniref:LacI family DNA-binding transcriptional regulator n=1 Tax=Loktanella sp. IMCC34160 TaxID=2510646 RepID=UPI00101D517B|nr:LacI family DNA-binding transcriptional regulator [Loktanella sp. IMCC34160]RYG92897.1 LacI family transcriptional regulator [Loktanella sp. IMCC34160]